MNAPRNPSNILRDSIELMRLHRPIGAWLLLWPALWALWLAGDGRPPVDLVVIFVLGVWVMRAAGCVVNDLADRRIDPQVTRTRLRPLARGALSVPYALSLFGALVLLAFILALQLNRAVLPLAAAALLVAMAYPYSKRFMRMPQILLGVAFSFGIPMAYAAQARGWPAEMWLLLAANFTWVVAYDTQYAMADRADDARLGVHSTAIVFGAAANFCIAVLQLICLTLLGVVGALRELHFLFYIGLAVAFALAGYQQNLCKTRAPAQCFAAFRNNNWFGAAVFAGIALGFTA